ncbi:hypothetical protein [Alkalicoccobacillus gibsonii]|uniref:hypothetical protein n=1 Tax=Alkalicoccobacillus gibsonii TaxID=79881 RepID=UPI003511FBA1
MLTMTIQIVITLVGAALIILVVQSFLQRKKNRFLEQEIEELSKKHDQLLAEVLQPYHDSSDKLKLTRGKTKKRFEELSEGFFTILHAVKEAQQNLDGLRVTRASYGTIVAVLPRAKSQLDEEFEKLNKMKTELEQLEKEDTDVAILEKEERAQLEEIEKQLQAHVRKTDYPLNNLVQKLNYLKRELNEVLAEDLDSITAKHDLEHLQSDRIELEKRLTRLQALFREQRHLAAQFEGISAELPESYQRFLGALQAGEVDRAETHLKVVHEDIVKRV